MTAQDYYEQAQQIDLRIRARCDDLANLTDLVKTISAASLEPKYNPNHSTEAPFVKQFEKIYQIEEKIQDDIDTMLALKEQINDTIKELPNIQEQMVLIYRYLQNRNFEDIAERLNVTTRSVYKWHASALKNTILPAHMIRI